MRTIARVAVVALGLAACTNGVNAAQQSGGWMSLFDGRTLNGWRASENPSTFSVQNGEIVVHGPRAHLFYEGPVMNHNFRDFELEAEVLTKPGANSGIFIRTDFQETGWPSKGYEVQVNNTQSDWRRTGSLYAVRDVREGLPDDQWFTMNVRVQGRRVQIRVNDRQTVDYTEPADSATRFTGSTIALQGHDPNSEVHYRNIRIRPLPN